MKFDSLIKSHPLILVDFYADWCGPCKTMAPILEQIKEEFGEKVKIVKINTEKNQRLAASKNIRSIPTLQFYKYGKMEWQQAGAVPFNALAKKIQPYM
ncbi:MAG: thioredoxin [Cytophagales bacterium]|nr:thioredoxin [Cytophagales bacterium]